MDNTYLLYVLWKYIEISFLKVRTGQQQNSEKKLIGNPMII